jgi:hypothetical protein
MIKRWFCVVTAAGIIGAMCITMRRRQAVHRAWYSGIEFEEAFRGDLTVLRPRERGRRWRW